MAKIFLVLTILAASAAGFFGWETYQQATVVKKNLTESKDATKKAQNQLNAVQITLKSTQGELADTHTKLDTANATIQTDQTTISGLNAQLDPLKAQVADLTDKLGKETDLYNAAVGHPQGPGPISSEAELLKQINDLKGQLAELTQINKTLTTKAAEAETHAKDLEEKEQKRQTGLKLPGIEGIVMAVNQGYNFAVVSLGDSQGAVPNAELLVKRGDTLIAKMKITTVEPVLSVADIIPDSVVKGQRVLPGDKVIFSGNMAQ